MTDGLTKEDCDEMERRIKRFGHAGNMQKRLSAAISMARAHLEARESGEGLVERLEKQCCCLDSPPSRQCLYCLAADALTTMKAEWNEAEAALWRVCPNSHTVPCEINAFAKPDLFEGVGETYKDAYERLEAERDSLHANLGRAMKALAFAKSTIKSGESWTSECEEIIDGALTIEGEF